MKRAALAAAIWLAAQVCLFAPLSVAQGNAGEFAADYWWALLWIMPPLAALIVAVAVVPVTLMPEWLARIWAAAVFGVAVAVWLQSNVLPSPPEMDGADYGSAGALASAIVWVAVIGTAVAWRRFLLPWAVRASVAMMAVQALASVAGAVETIPVTAANFPRLSLSRNVILVISDSMQSNIAAEVVAEMADEFDGFVYYRNTVTQATNTNQSYCALAYGVTMDGRALDEYLASLRGVRPTISHVLAAAGWSVMLATGDGGLRSHAPEYVVDPRQLLGLSPGAADAERLATASLLRVLPAPLRRHVYREGRGLADGWLMGISDPNAPRVLPVLDVEVSIAIASRIFVDSPQPALRIMYHHGNHPPYLVNERCRYEEMVPGPGMHQRIMRCVLLRFVLLLDALRSAGIYDNTMVILLGDHGIREMPTQRDIGGRRIGADWPALYIKPFGARGPLRTSNAPAHLADVPATIAAAAGVEWQGGADLLTLAEDAVRDRYVAGGWRLRGDVEDPAAWSKW